MNKKLLLFMTALIALVMGTSTHALDSQDLEQIQKAIQEKGARWQAGDSPVFRMSPEEQRRLCGLIQESPEEIDQNLLPLKGPKLELPERFDWRDVDGVNWVTPIRDQASCGSCVAFGTMAAFEARINIYSESPGEDMDLSEQHIFSCGGGSCSRGWWYGEAVRYLVDYGAPLESCLPYEARDDNCYQTCPQLEEQARKVSRWGWVPGAFTADKVEQMKIHLMDGPLVGGFDVYEDFFSYSSGVYQHVWGNHAGGHCICFVGWDDADSCWIVKNSWGPMWGDGGYFRIRMGHNEVDIEGLTLWMEPAPAFSALVEMVDYTIKDNIGNGDGLLDAGEILDLTITLENRRTWGSLEDVVGWLLPTDQRVEILDVQGSYTSGLPDGTMSTNDDDPFTVKMEEKIGISAIPFSLYVTGTCGGSIPYSKQLDFKVPVTTELSGWPVGVNSTIQCSPVMFWAGGGDWRLVASEDGGILHMWDETGQEVAGFPFSAPGGKIWGSVSVGDLEGDGSEEILLGSKNDTLYVLRSDGTLAFKQDMGADIMATPALADLDGDGGLEVVFGTTDAKIHALTVQGKEYSGFPVMLGGAVMADAALADLDGDGYLEIAVGATDGFLYVISTQTGEFLPGFPAAIGGAIWSSPVVADLDKDGFNEIIVGSDGARLHALKHTGDPLFVLMATQAIKSSPAVADLDGNGWLDVIFTTVDGYIYAVSSQGYMLSGWPYNSDGFLMSSPIVLDIDGDDALEVVVQAPGLKLLHLEADGSVLLELPLGVSGPAVSSPMVGDLDGDGDLEVAVGIPKGIYVWNYPTGSWGAQPWPMYRGNAQRTGYVGDVFTGRAENQEPAMLPVDYALWQNYPNPFNPHTTVRYSLREAGPVRLSVFNVLGQEVTSLVDGYREAGHHEATWDGTDASGATVSSGLYFSRLQAGDVVRTRKMVLLR